MIILSNLLLVCSLLFHFEKGNKENLSPKIQCFSFNEVDTLKNIEHNYDRIYLYKSEDGEVIQKLFVKYDLDNYIKYKLILTRPTCNFELVGEAEANQDLDGEIDEDADGNAYMAIEFKHQTEQFYLGIRIAENKEKVKIVFNYEVENKKQCPLESENIMYAEE